MVDWLQDWLGGIALAITTAVGGWLMGLSKRVHQDAMRLAVLEVRFDDMPKLLAEIRDEIRGLRKESEERAGKLYAHMDSMRREIKDDLAGKADK